MPVTVTERAMLEVKRVMEEQSLDISEYGLRVGVQGGGCAGFTYKLGFDRHENATVEEDESLEQHGIKVHIERRFIPYIEGTTVDFYEDLDKRGFVFDNPNAVRGCGCNKSFSVKDTEPEQTGGCGGCGGGSCG